MLLPELFLTGYDPACWTPEAASSTDDPVLAPLWPSPVAVARERSLGLPVGAALRRSRTAATLGPRALVTVPD